MMVHIFRLIFYFLSDGSVASILCLIHTYGHAVSDLSLLIIFKKGELIKSVSFDNSTMISSHKGNFHP